MMLAAGYWCPRLVAGDYKLDSGIQSLITVNGYGFGMWITA
jgi:hypothetical protein